MAGGELHLVAPDGTSRSAPITTLRAAGAFFGIECGMPATVYPPATPLDLDSPLPVDATTAASIGAWLALGQDALTRIGASHPDDGPEPPSSCGPSTSTSAPPWARSTSDSPRATTSIPRPYAYVGPWTPKEGPFWNQPFGAARTVAELATVDDVLRFFEEGRSLALPG